MISRQTNLNARDRSMREARKARDLARFYAREGADARADFTREQAALYVKDARHFNHRALRAPR